MVFGFGRGQETVELSREDEGSQTEVSGGQYTVEFKVSPDVAEAVKISGGLIMASVTVYSVYDKESKQPRKCDRNYQTYLIASEKYYKEIGGGNGSGKVEVNEIDPLENTALKRVLSKGSIRVSKALITAEAEQALNNLSESDGEGKSYEQHEIKV